MPDPDVSKTLREPVDAAAAPARPAAPARKPAIAPTPGRPGSPANLGVLLGIAAVAGLALVAGWLTVRSLAPEAPVSESTSTARVEPTDTPSRPEAPRPRADPPTPSPGPPPQSSVPPSPPRSVPETAPPAPPRTPPQETAPVPAPRKEPPAAAPRIPAPAPPAPRPTPPAPRPAPVGTLRVKGLPGTRVFLDNVDRGTIGALGELRLSDVPVGSHTVRVERGNRVANQSATVYAGIDGAVDVSAALAVPVPPPASPPVVAELPPAPAPTPAPAPEPPAASAPPPEASPAPAAPRPPALPPRGAGSRTFAFEGWPRSHFVEVGPNGIRYEKRRPDGSIDSALVSSSCADIVEAKSGAFGGSFRIRLRNGQKAEIERGDKKNLEEVRDALSRACGRKF
jgi:hypothetical protein